MRLLSGIVAFRQGEATTGWLMFAYSFLAMTSYNILKPITRSKFISALGADNLPYVQLAAGVLIGLLMLGHTQAMARVPRRWVIPVTQSILAAVLLAFWPLFYTNAAWVSVAFYVFGLILGVLLISQFWTLANDIYDPRQARRLFGFIGGGASLGGATGAGLTALTVETVGTNNLLPVSAMVLVMCLLIAATIIRRQSTARDLSLAAEPRGVGGAEAIRMLRRSRHLQVITLVIGCAAIGAVFIEQQLNMAAGASKDSTDAITRFLAEITVYLSLVGFVVQVGLTSRIHRSLGLAFALLLLPITLGASAFAILLTGALWAPSLARVLDTSLRYSLDKTTREVLFLPLPADLKYRAKPFVDVTMDRFAKAAGSVALLLLIKPWGLGLSWPQVSYASLVVMAAWIAFALIARREYLSSFRRSLETREMEPAAVRFEVADAATMQTLVNELSKPDEGSVLYAIDMLETLGKRDLIPPLLLHHDSARVRARTLDALGSAAPDRTGNRTAAVRRMLSDPDAGVRAAAVRAMVALAQSQRVGRSEGAAMLRQYLADAEPRVAVTAAAELADSGQPADIQAAEATLARFVADTRVAAAPARRDAAAALARIRNPSFRSLLVALIHDPDPGVAREAIASARALGAGDALFVPALVSLLGDRVLKRPAREALLSYGPDIIDVLAHFMTDPQEDIWVRRHVPATLARIPSQRSMDALAGALSDPDGFLRYKIVEAMETLRRSDATLDVPAAVIEALTVKETARYYSYLSLRYNLVERSRSGDGQSLLVRALDDKLARAVDRVFRLLGLLHPWQDMAAARYAIEEGGDRARARALEYLDNVLHGAIRRRVMPVLESAPMEDRVRHANSVIKSRPREVDDTVAQLIHEDDPVVSACAIHFVAERQVWASLAGDVEFALGHRSSDALVREAAAWALASRERPAAARDHAAPVPVVELANRLRAIPLFSFVSIDELFRVAGAATQVQHARGHTLSLQGAPADQVLFLLHGSVRVLGGDPARSSVAAPAALNFADALEGRPLRHTIEAAEPVVALTVDASDFLTMLSDNIATAQGLFRMLLTSPVALDWAEVHVPPAPAVAPAVREPVVNSVDPIEKALRLRQSPLFGRATVEELKALTAVTREVTLQDGSVLWGPDREPAIYHLLDCEVILEADGLPRQAIGPGSTIGVAETLANSALNRRAVVVRGGRALGLDHDQLFDVLADHGDLLQGVFGGVLGASAMETGGGAR